MFLIVKVIRKANFMAVDRRIMQMSFKWNPIYPSLWLESENKSAKLWDLVLFYKSLQNRGKNSFAFI